MAEREVLEEQAQLSGQLLALITRLATERTPDTLLHALLDAALTALPLPHGLALLAGDGALTAQAARGHFTHLSPEELRALQADFESRAAALGTGEALHVSGIGGATTRALLPLRLDGRLLGLLVLDHDGGPEVFTPARRQFLHTVALQGAIAIGRVQLITQLEHSETRYRRLMDESPVGIAAGSIDGGLSEVNDAYLRLLGFTREEFARGEVDWSALTPPEYLPQDEAAFQRAFEHGTSGHYEKEMLTRSGERVPLDIVLLRYAEGDRRGVVGYVQDLRPQRAQEARWAVQTSDLQGQLDHNLLALAQQKAELEARTSVLEGFATLTRDLTLETDPYRLIGRAQQFALTLLPAHAFAVYYEPEGGLWRLKAQTGDLGSPALQAVLDAGLPFEATTNLLIPWQSGAAHYQDAYDPHGDTVAEATTQLQTTATLPLSVRAQLRGVFAIGLNVAQPWSRVDKVILESVVKNLGLALERAEQARTLQHRTLALERSNRELEQFAYIASHDLQEPLRTVTSFTELLLRRPTRGPDAKAAQYAEHITAGTARMQDLIADLLAFSRVSIHPRALEPTNVAAILALVERDLFHRLQESQGQLTVGECPPVLGDAAQLRQLFQNLIGNALKFRSPERTPRVTVSAQRDGQWVRITVADNGIGIEPTYFERIFTVFQRLHNRDRYEGNGIGLAIVRKIVERHGGEISVSSVPGEGTAFAFTVPVVPAAGD